jgi:hypothetical protein
MGRKVRANAEARRIAAELGLGRPVRAWRRRSKVTEWVLALGFLIGLPGITAVLAVTAELREQISVPEFVALGTVLALPAVIAFRGHWPVLYEFEAGVANVSSYRRVVTVVRWADLASVSEDTFLDEDDHEHFRGYLLRDHAGNTVDIGKRTRQLVARAERVLAARLGQPAP